ncbi:MAG TPA: Maf family protein [Thermoanaerobaculia bacterium]|nr:Maf family protein [Thermoanaerobaculia bacterium]
MNELILASMSPRRRDLLESIGLEFEVVPSDVEEIPAPGEQVRDYVLRLAREKAESIGGRHPDAWIIAADTVVYLDDRILEKPRDHDEAFAMLSTIAGRWHTVFSGVALHHSAGGHLDCRLEETRVRIMALEPSEIEWYVETGEPFDKAGAYAVQGIGAMFVEAVEGSYTNVVGLPLPLLFRMMRDAGIDPIPHHQESWRRKEGAAS